MWCKPWNCSWRGLLLLFLRLTHPALTLTVPPPCLLPSRLSRSAGEEKALWLWTLHPSHASNFCNGALQFVLWSQLARNFFLFSFHTGRTSSALPVPSNSTPFPSFSFTSQACVHVQAFLHLCAPSRLLILIPQPLVYYQKVGSPVFCNLIFPVC